MGALVGVLVGAVSGCHRACVDVDMDVGAVDVDRCRGRGRGCRRRGSLVGVPCWSFIP
jgi:hypothetical protein